MVPLPSMAISAWQGIYSEGTPPYNNVVVGPLAVPVEFILCWQKARRLAEIGTEKLIWQLATVWRLLANCMYSHMARCSRSDTNSALTLNFLRVAILSLLFQ